MITPAFDTNTITSSGVLSSSTGSLR